MIFFFFGGGGGHKTGLPATLLYQSCIHIRISMGTSTCTGISPVVH